MDVLYEITSFKLHFWKRNINWTRSKGTRVKRFEILHNSSPGHPHPSSLICCCCRHHQCVGVLVTWSLKFTQPSRTKWSSVKELPVPLLSNLACKCSSLTDCPSLSRNYVHVHLLSPSRHHSRVGRQPLLHCSCHLSVKCHQQRRRRLSNGFLVEVRTELSSINCWHRFTNP